MAENPFTTSPERGTKAVTNNENVNMTATVFIGGVWTQKRASNFALTLTERLPTIAQTGTWQTYTDSAVPLHAQTREHNKSV